MIPKPANATAKFFFLVSLIIILAAFAFAQERQRVADDPDDEEDLNRELWEMASRTPYEKILAYVSEAQRLLVTQSALA